ncbi:MAG: agmatine deiminase family protein [Bacteroidales bacterium]|nr:agmatine deiminase family protein [Bacteroidales bacterium]
MKHNISKHLFSLLMIFFIFQSFNSIQAQEKKLTHHMTPEEMLRKDEIGKDFYPTDPPEGNVRQTAEFERMESVLIRYPFGIPMALIVEMAEDCMVTTIVANQSQENSVKNQYSAAGINLDNCDFIHAPTDSYWTRDYGPWYVVDGNYDVGIVNFPYNRPRPNDDDIPIAVANYLGIDLFGMDLISTGGNYMTDGMGISASTELIWEENPSLSHDDVDNLVESYLGIHTYHVLPDPLNEYIDHIDCWGKFLDVDKVLIGEVPITDYRYDDFEYVANYFAEQISSYGNLYQVFRVFTPGINPGTPYTNSLILNEKVLIPILGSQYDDDALAVYEEAMPGYEIIGVENGGYGWANTDALHCRTRGMADRGMLYIRHIPLLGEVPQESEFEIIASIIPYSGEDLYTDSLLVYYKVNNGAYTSLIMTPLFGSAYKAAIPQQAIGSEVSYFIHAADYSGRSEDHPFIGFPDPHVFTVVDPLNPDVTVSPDSLIFLDYISMTEGLDVTINNFNGVDITINNINNEGFDAGFLWVVDPWTIELPYVLPAGDSLVLTVVIPIPIDFTGDLLCDTMFIETDENTHQVFICVDEDLVQIENNNISGLTTTLGNNYPNPFSSETQINFYLEKSSNVTIEIFDIKGQKVYTLVDKNLFSGNHSVKWNAKDSSEKYVPDGLYFVRMKTGEFSACRKMILMR